MPSRKFCAKTMKSSSFLLTLQIKNASNNFLFILHIFFPSTHYREIVRVTHFDQVKWIEWRSLPFTPLGYNFISCTILATEIDSVKKTHRWHFVPRMWSAPPHKHHHWTPLPLVRLFLRQFTLLTVSLFFLDSCVVHFSHFNCSMNCPNEFSLKCAGRRNNDWLCYTCNYKGLGGIPICVYLIDF